VQVRYNPSYVRLYDSSVRFSGSAGVAFSDAAGVSASANSVLARTQVSDNATYGVHFISPATLSIHGSTLGDNGDWAVYGVGYDMLRFMGNDPTGARDPNTFFNSDGSVAHLGIVAAAEYVNNSGTWTNDVPIVIAGDAGIWNNRTIDVEAGTVFNNLQLRSSSPSRRRRRNSRTGTTSTGPRRCARVPV